MNKINPSPSERIVAAVFGVFFGGIGLAILGGILTTWDSEFPPLFFRVVGGLMSLPPLAIGAMALFAAITGKAPNALAGRTRGQIQNLLKERHRKQAGMEYDTVAKSYTCPRCAAPLETGAEVSPSGDVKCDHCASWFNVRHGG